MKKQYFKNFRKEGLPGGPNEITINSEGFILSENGQWEFPGLPTVIPSSDITMEDVPYPVLGISDTGDTQMMYPEEDYQFDGDMVYELPMAQKGYNVKPRKGSILVEGETEPSTHLMRREYIPNTGWVAFPSLFQNEDGTWVDMSKEEDWMNIYDEANRRGEVYNFGENKRKAIKFADKGSWKKHLGIKKQGGGDISIPDLTKPNWLDTLPKAQNGKITEAIYKYAKQFKPGSVDDSQQMDNLSDLITDEFPNVNKTWLRDVMWGTPLKEPVLTGFEEEGRTFKNYKELKLYNLTHDSETGLPIDFDKVNREDSKGMFPMSYPNYKPKFIEKQNDVSIDTPGDVDDSNEDKLQYAKGGWLNNLPKAQNGKMLTREKKRLLKEKEFEDFLKKSSVDEQGTLTYVLPEYTVKSPEKKLYDEAYNKSIAQQQAFQNSWYPGSTDSDNLGYAPGVMDNIKQRATVKANDFVAKNLVNNNKIGDLKDYQKDYIATSNYSGKLRPNIGKQFTEGVQDLGRITQGKLPTTKALGILSPLEYPVNLVRGTVKGEGLDALKGNISSPWLDANDVDPGAVNEVGVYNTMTDLALDPLNLSGTGALLGRTGVKYLNKALKTSKESGVLSNAYKINPWAFKPDPKAYYRMIGKEGYTDALESGIVRPPQTSRIFDQGSQKYIDIPIPAYEEAYYNAQFPLDRRWYPNSIKKTNPQKAALATKSGYQGPYMAEVTGDSHLFEKGENVAAYTGPNSSQTVTYSKEHIPITNPNLKFYKEDWLRGYKQVPKNLPSNISPVQSGFPNPLGIVDAVFPRINPLGFVDKVGPMSMSPLNLLPFYGKKLGEKGQLFRKFGNSMDDVTKRGVLSPSGGSKLRMGRNQIVNEGNWAAMDAPNEQYPGVFEATINPKLEESNLGFKSIPKRNGVLVTDKAGNNLLEIPLTDPGLSFNRRLPFSNRYVPINKEKLINKKFQLSTQLPHLQSIAEKYGVGLGIAGGAELIGFDGAIDKYNKYTVDPIINWSKDQYNKLTNDKKAFGGWLNNLPKAQKGNTGKQSANESWGLTQESQLSDLTKGLLNNILHRQAFAESSFNPKVISGDKTSRVGALGMTQIMPETLNEYINKTGDKNINILDPKDAVKVQKWYMQDLLNADFIHKPNQSEKVRMVKALGSYNWGRGNMSKFLGKQKKKGVDIYSDELSWVNDLPVETRDYVNKIVLGTNEKFNQEYKQNSSKYKDYYQKGGWLDKL